MVTFWGQKQPKKPPPTPQALREMGDFYVTRMEPPAGCYLAKRNQQQHTALAGKPLHTCLLGLKYLFSATGLRKTKNILMVLSRHCKVKKKKSQQNNKRRISHQQLGAHLPYPSPLRGDLKITPSCALLSPQLPRRRLREEFPAPGQVCSCSLHMAHFSSINLHSLSRLLK